MQYIHTSFSYMFLILISFEFIYMIARMMNHRLSLFSRVIASSKNPTKRQFHIVHLGDSRLPETYTAINYILSDRWRRERAGGIENNKKSNNSSYNNSSNNNPRAADIMITDPPYLLLERRRRGGDLRDPKRASKRIDNNEAVPRFSNVQEYRIFTSAWINSSG